MLSLQSFHECSLCVCVCVCVCVLLTLYFIFYLFLFGKCVDFNSPNLKKEKIDTERKQFFDRNVGHKFM